MRLLLGILVGFSVSVLGFYLVWDPEQLYPFSEKWNDWRVEYRDPPETYVLRSRLMLYPLVNCRIAPQMTGIGLTTVRVGVKIEGLEYLPLLTKDGYERLSYECLTRFSKTYSSEKLNALLRRNL